MILPIDSSRIISSRIINSRIIDSREGSSCVLWIKKNSVAGLVFLVFPAVRRRNTPPRPFRTSRGWHARQPGPDVLAHSGLACVEHLGIREPG